MNARACFRILSAVFLLVVVQHTASARQVPGTDAAQASAAAKTSAAMSAATSGPRSSPHEPPKENDHSFVTDSDPKLDTGCLYRSSGPITYEIKITRHVGEVNGDGTLTKASELVADRYLHPKAILFMPAFDVDSEARIPGINPERDRVLFNGEEVGFLKGIDGAWELNRFEIPIELVRFPERAEVGGDGPEAAINEVSIEIDTANSGQHWCTSIDWGNLGFGAMSPIILIHGNNSDGEFFDRQGFTDILESKNLLYDNSISMETDGRALNAVKLDTLIPDIVKSFGVDGVHLVAHSKGGLDVRDYLAHYQPDHDEDFKVLSLNTLSTPHNGSVAADLATGRAHYAQAGEVEVVGFPTVARWISAYYEWAGVNDATRDLTLQYCSDFNFVNVPRLPSNTIYNTVAGDADQNGDGEINNSPDEYLEMRVESTALTAFYANFPEAARIGIDAIYRSLRRNERIEVDAIIDDSSPDDPTVIYVLTGIPGAGPIGNDILVSIPSGHGFGRFNGRVLNTSTVSGYNHASIANGEIAYTVITWIHSAEMSNGDLR